MGVEGNFENVAGENARFESEVTITGEISLDTLASRSRFYTQLADSPARLRKRSLVCGGHGASGAGAVLTREAGRITFGEHGHSLGFSTVGQGYLADSAQPALKHGTVTWKVDRGAGQFVGARWPITSNFTISESGEVTDHHFGLIFVK